MCGTSFDGLVLPVEREGKKQVTTTTGASTCICHWSSLALAFLDTEPLILSLCLVDLVMEGSSGGPAAPGFSEHLPQAETSLSHFQFPQGGVQWIAVFFSYDQRINTHQALLQHLSLQTPNKTATSIAPSLLCRDNLWANVGLCIHNTTLLSPTRCLPMISTSPKWTLNTQQNPGHCPAVLPKDEWELKYTFQTGLSSYPSDSGAVSPRHHVNALTELDVN